RRRAREVLRHRDDLRVGRRRPIESHEQLRESAHGRPSLGTLPKNADKRGDRRGHRINSQEFSAISTITALHLALFTILLVIAFGFRCSANHTAVQAALSEVSRQRVRMAMSREDAAGANLLDRAEQRWPVRVVGQHEAPVYAVLPPYAANAH